LDLFDACVVFFRRKPWDLVSDGCLDALSIINRHAVAKLIEPLMHSVPKVAAVVNDFDFALRDAREQRDLTLARVAVDQHTLDDNSSPPNILSEHIVMPKISARLLALSTFPSHVHGRVVVRTGRVLRQQSLFVGRPAACNSGRLNP